MCLKADGKMDWLVAAFGQKCGLVAQPDPAPSEASDKVDRSAGLTAAPSPSSLTGVHGTP